MGPPQFQSSAWSSTHDAEPQVFPMIRNLTAVAVATALVAGPASGQAIRVSAAGKTAQQMKTAIRVAAREVCFDVYANTSTPLAVQNACIHDVEHNAQNQLKGRSY